VRGHPGNVDIIEDNLPPSGMWLPVIRLKTVVFPARWTNETDDAALLDVEGDVVHAMRPPKDLVRFFRVRRLIREPRLSLRPHRYVLGVGGRIPWVRKIIMTIMASPKIIMRASAKSRNISGRPTKRNDPRRTPGMLPEPPRITMANMTTDSQKLKDSGR